MAAAEVVEVADTSSCRAMPSIRSLTSHHTDSCSRCCCCRSGRVDTHSRCSLDILVAGEFRNLRTVSGDLFHILAMYRVDIRSDFEMEITETV